MLGFTRAVIHSILFLVLSMILTACADGITSTVLLVLAMMWLWD